MATKKKKPRLERTISQELHDEWVKLTRKNDAKSIAEKLEVSKPTIDNALIYGNVHQQRLIDGINSYFKERLENENKQAAELRELQTQSTN